MVKYLVIIFYSLFLLLFSCDITESNSDLLLGTWVDEDEIYVSDGIKYLSTVELTFYEDDKWETERLVYSADSNILLGYRFSAKGSYNINKDKLTRIWEAQKSSNDELILFSVTKLIPEQIELIEEHIEITVSVNSLTLDYPPCGPLENCIDKSVFTKK